MYVTGCRLKEIKGDGLTQMVCGGGVGYGRGGGG
jgi:hypothetical protein